MKKIITLITLAVLSTTLYAQNDTVPAVQNVDIEVYDVVAIYRQGQDGRGRPRRYTSELRGEIIKYDESTGVLTFKGIDGRMYSLASDKYEYFQYDKEFTKKKKRQKVLLPRKASGFELSVGLSAGFLNIPTGFQMDENYVGGTTDGFELPVCIKVGGSKYLNKNSLVGLTAEYSLFGSETTYFNAGARYQYLYNPKKNASFYLPIELKFSHYQADYYNYQFNDTVYDGNGGAFWPMDVVSDVTINALEFNIGQGVSFALKNNRSLSLEVMLLRQFILSEEVKVSNQITAPQTDFSVYGMKLSLFMNF